MKTWVTLLVLVLLMSCGNGIKPDKSEIASNKSEVYRSSDDSFQKDFYLKIEDEKATIYGWDVSTEKDTIYYRSICKLEEDSTDGIQITLKNYQFTEVKVREENLNDFKVNEELSLDNLGEYSSFWGEKKADGSFHFLAVKHIYHSRADEFTFERIK